jgi:glycosyltransferase involved in cell wall biosynthesis
MVVHEAARCGVPSVSRRSGAVQEFVESGVSGFIYDDGDVETAARQLLELNSRPDVHQRILAGLQRQLEDYDPRLLGSQYVRLLCEGLSSR